MISGTIAALIGQALPEGILGMDFALTALFVVLAWESFKSDKDFSLPVIAAAFAIGAAWLAPGQMLIIALTLYFLVLLLRNASPRMDEVLTWKKGGANE